ncbi:AraC family transcriptional regulator [Gaoshiqia sediminis]|uniref:Helix-turn-helix transcriptional regulator n=1 Tax=Gaoshiqia sediminis TaxID=2986998 RepID=A0AA42CAB2_9BACT|nr:helix-turn-helix domain-containing protein [Gaoshiqia sediminis]MCW0483260.1 helix-turn-helix transcriptional regulator [Gaoshiqia sediminis]
MHNEITTYGLTDLNGAPVEFILKDMGALYEAATGEADRPHRHDYFTILLIEKASGKHIIDFQEYQLFDHCLYFIYPGQVHQLIASEKPTGWVLNFSKSFLVHNNISDQMINDVYLFNKHGETPPLPVNETDFQNYKNLVWQISQYRDLELDYKNEAMGALLKLILIHSNTHCTLHKEKNPQRLEAGNQLVRRFKKLIDLHYKELHKVSDYADKLLVTSDYLNKSVKSLTGKSAKEYILERILVEAKRVLLFTELSNKELAFELGFEEPAHFSNFFKKYNGLSPIDFRNSARQS